MKVKSKIAKVIKFITKYMALAACGATSYWGGYQMKEPENIYKR